jgi:hypothetical protein
MSASIAVNSTVPVRFLRIAYHADDWIAVLVKRYESDRAAQRVGPLRLFMNPRFQAWLRAENAAGANVYVSVNAVAPEQRSRRRETIRDVRHVFLDVDSDATSVLTNIQTRPDLPTPSYVIRSSWDRAQVLWRVSNFTTEAAEMLQKHLAREFRGDSAATSASQMARVPGFFNHKYMRPPLVTIEYRDSKRTYTQADFPDITYLAARPRAGRYALPSSDRAERARTYLAAVPPAIAGQHGDLHTFRMCCRLVRGFALTDADALRILTEWSARCQPPWSERELRDKLRHARRYGSEPIGGLLEMRS